MRTKAYRKERIKIFARSNNFGFCGEKNSVRIDSATNENSTGQKPVLKYVDLSSVKILLQTEQKNILFGMIVLQILIRAVRVYEAAYGPVITRRHKENCIFLVLVKANEYNS